MQVYEQQKPWESHEERMVSIALASTQTPGIVLQNTVRPPLPLIQVFPARFGYLDVQDRQPTIEGVLGINRLYGDERDAISGGPGGYRAASRNVQSDGAW